MLGMAWSARAGASFAKRGPGERSDSLKTDQRVFKIARLEGAVGRAGTLPLLASERSWRGRERPVAALAFKMMNSVKPDRTQIIKLLGVFFVVGLTKWILASVASQKSYLVKCDISY